MEKKVNIRTEVPVRSISENFNGVILNKSLDVNTIRTAMLGKARITEILENGEEVELTFENYANNNEPNKIPIIYGVAESYTIYTGQSIDFSVGVSCFDTEDGDITDKLVVSYPEELVAGDRYEISFSVTDSRGDTVVLLSNLIVLQNQSPVLTGAPDVLVTKVGLPFNPLAGISAYDEEDGDITDKIEVLGETIYTSAGNYVITYRVKDSMDGVATHICNVTVQANEKPVIIGVEDTLYRIGTGEFDLMKGITASDTEDGDITNNITIIGTVDFTVEGVYTITYSVSDSYNQTVSVDRNIEVKALPIPYIEGLTDLSIVVGAEVDLVSGVTATCPEDGDITENIIIADTYNTEVKATYSVNYSVTNTENMTASENRKLVVRGDTIPTISGMDTVSVFIGTEVDIMSGVTAYDEEDGDLTGLLTVSGSVNTDVAGTYKITYSVTDQDNNEISKTKTFIIKTNDSPVFTGISNIVTKYSNLNLMSGVTAYDTEDGDLTSSIQIIGEVEDEPGIYDITYSVTDSDNNTTTASIKVTISANVPPTISGLDTIYLVASEDTIYDPMDGIVAMDEEDGNITGKVTIVTNTTNVSKVGTYLITYSVTDNNGNTVTATRQVIVQINQEPVITASNRSVYVKHLPINILEGVSAYDVEDGDITGLIVVEGTIGTDPGLYSITLSVTDSYGNSTTKSIIITVLEDVYATFAGITNTTVLTGYESSFDPMSGVTATCRVDGDLTNNVVVIAANSLEMGENTIKYQVANSLGNITEVSRTVTVTTNEKPVINYGQDNIEILAKSSFDPLEGVTASDYEDGDITSSIKVSGNVLTTQAGTYILTYTVDDKDGNRSIVNRNVIVTSNFDPIFSGISDVTVLQNKTFDPLAGVTCYDEEDGDITENIVVSGFEYIDFEATGIFDIDYSVTDSHGNKVTKNRVITVEPNTVPIITGTTDIEILQSEINTFDFFDGVYAYDAEDGDISENLTIPNKNILTSIPNLYVLEYSITDKDGNTSKSLRNVTVFTDTEPVLLNVTDRSVFETKLEDFDLLAGIEAYDAEDGDITDKIIVTGEVGTEVGTYPITVSVTDSHDNEVSATFNVIVNSDKIPVFAEMNDITIFIDDLDTLDLLDGVSAEDHEDGDLSNDITVAHIMNSQGFVINEITLPGTYRITYSVIDSNDNEVNHIRFVHVESDFEPEINGAINVKVITGEEYNLMTGISAYDIEDGILTNNIEVTGDYLDCNTVGEYNITYTVRDKNDNIATVSRKITVGYEVESVVVNDIDTVPFAIDYLQTNTARDPINNTLAFFPNSYGYIYISRDDGTSWSRIDVSTLVGSTTGASIANKGILYSKTHSCYVAISNLKLIASYDGGITWVVKATLAAAYYMAEMRDVLFIGNTYYTFNLTTILTNKFTCSTSNSNITTASSSYNCYPLFNYRDTHVGCTYTNTNAIRSYTQFTNYLDSSNSSYGVITNYWYKDTSNVASTVASNTYRPIYSDITGFVMHPCYSNGYYGKFLTGSTDRSSTAHATYFVPTDLAISYITHICEQDGMVILLFGGVSTQYCLFTRDYINYIKIDLGETAYYKHAIYSNNKFIIFSTNLKAVILHVPSKIDVEIICNKDTTSYIARGSEDFSLMGHISGIDNTTGEDITSEIQVNSDLDIYSYGEYTATYTLENPNEGGEDVVLERTLIVSDAGNISVDYNIPSKLNYNSMSYYVNALITDGKGTIINAVNNSLHHISVSKDNGKTWQIVDLSIYTSSKSSYVCPRGLYSTYHECFLLFIGTTDGYKMYKSTDAFEWVYCSTPPNTPNRIIEIPDTGKILFMQGLYTYYTTNLTSWSTATDTNSYTYYCIGYHEEVNQVIAMGWSTLSTKKYIRYSSNDAITAFNDVQTSASILIGQYPLKAIYIKLLKKLLFVAHNTIVAGTVQDSIVAATSYNNYENIYIGAYICNIIEGDHGLLLISYDSVDGVTRLYYTTNLIDIFELDIIIKPMYWNGINIINTSPYWHGVYSDGKFILGHAYATYCEIVELEKYPIFSKFIDTEYITLNGAFIPMNNIIAFSIKDGKLTNNVTYTGSVDTKTEGEYEVTYTVTDSDGNTTARIKKVIVYNPFAVITGTVDTEIKQGEEINLLEGISATDYFDGDLTDSIIVSGTVDNSIPDEYEITYSVTNSKLYKTTESRTITVIELFDPTIEGIDDIEVEINTEFNHLSGVTATDVEDGDLTEAIIVTGLDELDLTNTGEYTLTYSVTDSDERTTSKDRVITVVTNDVPVITLPEDSDINLTIDYVWSLEDIDTKVLDGVTANDTEDGDITDNIVITYADNWSEVFTTIEDNNMSYIGETYVTLTVTDSKENSTSVSRNIIIIDPSPIVTMSSDTIYFEETTNSSTSLVNDEILLDGVTAIDKDSTDITSYLTVGEKASNWNDIVYIDVDVNFDESGTPIVSTTYSLLEGETEFNIDLEDDHGNMVSMVRKIIVTKPTE